MGQIFPWLVYQQDYLWFLTAFGWGVLAFAKRRLTAAGDELAWLPWGAAASIMVAGLEVSRLITPVEMAPHATPWLAWELALGGIQALLAGELWWVVARRKNWSWHKIVPAVLAAIAAAALHYTQPLAGALALALLVIIPLTVLMRIPGTSGITRVALGALALASLFATNGPLAEGFGFPDRYTEMSPYGLPFALCLLGAAIAAGFALYRQAGTGPAASITQSDLSLLIRAQFLWLILGLALAAVMGTWARKSFEGNLLARVRMASELVDKPYLEANLGPAYRVNAIIPTEFQGRKYLQYRSDYLAHHGLEPLRGNLATIELANPDADWAMIITLRDDMLTNFCWSSRMPPLAQPGVLGLYGPADERDWLAWSERRAEILAPVTFQYGAVVQARAPLLGSNKKMLGWLIFDVGLANWLAAQVQARLLAFAVIALGSALLVVNWQQRIRERLRAAVQREADAAQEANRVKAAFLAKVSHELRTPIQSLLGYSELLRQRVSGDAKAAGWLANLQQHGELMTRLVNDLVDLGAIEAGAFRLAPHTVEPGNLVSQTVESFRPRAENKQLSLACFIDPALPEWVALDGERFRQVLINLLGNAIKFTDRGGVTVALRCDADQLLLTVRDTGPGIAPAEQSRLFVAFSRLELTAAKEGSGLGLALSAALCRAMGGSLQVASDGATGACFTAVVRALVAQPLLADKPVDVLSALRGRSVLVVDDNPLVRELFISFLTEQGAMCAAAATGKEALEQAGAGAFNAVILDLALPDGDGTEFVRPLRERIDGARIIGVSAHASSADRERATAAGMDAFLTKPVPLGALAAAVADERVARLEGTPTFRTADALRERLTRQFARELPGQRDELGTALAARNWPRAQAIAHYLKNSAVVVRDDALFDVCTGLEQAAEAGDEQLVARWWTRCRQTLDHWLVTHTPPSSSASPAGKNPNP